MLMLGDKAGLTGHVPVHPNGVGWGRGWGSVQVSRVLLHQTSKNHFFMGLCLFMDGAVSCGKKNGLLSNCT